MTLHLHHLISEDDEALAARCSELTLELINVIRAEHDAELRGLLAAGACGEIIEAIIMSLPGGQEALDRASAPLYRPMQ